MVGRREEGGRELREEKGGKAGRGEREARDEEGVDH